MRPILFSLGSLDFFAAPVFAGLSALTAFWYLRRSRVEARLTDEDFWHVVLALCVGTIAGGVLAHAFFYGGGIADNAAHFLSTGRIRGGAFFGNLWGAAAGAALAARLRRLDFKPIADLLGAASVLALTVMRWGCLQHGCCYGKPTDLAWAIVFDHPRAALRRSLHGIPLHPSQIYESLGCLAIFVFLHFAVFPLVRRGRLAAGSVFAASLALYGAWRFCVDFLRGGDQGLLRPFGMGTSQLFAAASIAAACILYRRWSQDAR